MSTGFKGFWCRGLQTRGTNEETMTTDDIVDNVWCGNAQFLLLLLWKIQVSFLLQCALRAGVSNSFSPGATSDSRLPSKGRNNFRTV